MTELQGARTYRRALWIDLPIINCALYAWSMAHAELTNFAPARPDLAWTFVFPLLVVFAAYRLRWARLQPVAKRTAWGVMGVTMLLIGLDYLAPNQVLFTHAELRNIYEASAIANTALLMFHAFSFGGWSRVALFLGPVALYGMLLENGGIWMGYFSELEYRWYLGPLPAPIATMSGWVTVFYLVTWLTWNARDASLSLRRSPFVSACFATLCALALDLQIDPLASFVGFWRWDHRLPEGFLGVPWLNFVAWACAVMPFAWVMFHRESTERLRPGDLARPRHRQWLWPRIPMALSLAGVFFIATLTAYEGGTTGPGMNILGDALNRVGEILLVTE